MKPMDKEVLALLKRVMSQCKKERKTHTRFPNRMLAKQLGITENYISALESARAIPSIKTFLKYLLINGFDIGPLENLQITGGKLMKPSSKLKVSLMRKIDSFDHEQLVALLEIVGAIDSFSSKRRARRKDTKKRTPK